MWKLITVVLIFNSYKSVSGTVDVCIPRKSELNEEINFSESNQHEKIPDQYTDHLPFNFSHPAIRARGSLDNTTTSFGDYDLKIVDQQWQFYNFTLKYITNVGQYNITGNIGDLFDIFGQGNYWLSFLNISVASSIWLPKLNSTHICIPLDIKLHVREVKAHFDNLMGDKELEDIINEAIVSILPQVLELIWEDLKVWNHDIYQEMMNNYINGRKKNGVVSRYIRKKVQDYFNKNPEIFIHT